MDIYICVCVCVCVCARIYHTLSFTHPPIHRLHSITVKPIELEQRLYGPNLRGQHDRMKVLNSSAHSGRVADN